MGNHKNFINYKPVVGGSGVRRSGDFRWKLLRGDGDKRRVPIGKRSLANNEDEAWLMSSLAAAVVFFTESFTDSVVLWINIFDQNRPKSDVAKNYKISWNWYQFYFFSCYIWSLATNLVYLPFSQFHRPKSQLCQLFASQSSLLSVQYQRECRCMHY